MENKTTKFLFKMLILFPVGFGIYTLQYGFENFHWFFPTITGFIFAFGVVFWNLFDYEKFTNIELTDFLESSHKLNIQNCDDNWNRIIDLVEKSIIKLKVLDKSKSNLKVQVPRKFFDSILTIEKEESSIAIKIEKKGFLKFLPDNAENYKSLQKIKKTLNITATSTVSS